MYDPLAKMPELWLDFANLKPKGTDQIVKFARKYGPLGLNLFMDDYPIFTEYLLHWRREIITMRALCDLYYDVQHGRSAALAHRFRPDPRDTGMVIYLYDRANSPSRYEEVVPPDKVGFGGKLEDVELVERGWGCQALGDLDRPLDMARTFIAGIIEERLYGHITPMVDTSQKEPVAVLNIPSLLGATYMQVWLELASGEFRKVDKCRYCEDWFKKTRSNRKYCSDSCGGSLRKMKSRAKKRRDRQPGGELSLDV